MERIPRAIIKDKSNFFTRAPVLGVITRGYLKNCPVMRYQQLTDLFIEDNLRFQFRLALEALVDLSLFLLLRFRPVEKFASATLLHDLRSRKSCQLAEAIRAINDWIDRRDLRISQYKVAVCEQESFTFYVLIIVTSQKVCYIVTFLLLSRDGDWLIFKRDVRVNVAREMSSRRERAFQQLECQED